MKHGTWATNLKNTLDRPWGNGSQQQRGGEQAPGGGREQRPQRHGGLQQAPHASTHSVRAAVAAVRDASERDSAGPSGRTARGTAACTASATAALMVVGYDTASMGSANVRSGARLEPDATVTWGLGLPSRGNRHGVGKCADELGIGGTCFPAGLLLTQPHPRVRCGEQCTRTARTSLRCPRYTQPKASVFSVAR
jgi:hypothetical protein